MGQLRHSDRDSQDPTSARRLLLTLKEARAKIEDFERLRSEPLAIVGMGCRLPGNVMNPSDFWKILHHGQDAVTEVPKDRWDIEAFYHSDPDVPGKICTRYGGFLHQVDRFDSSFFGISRREARAMDPQQRLLLEVSWEALEDANIAPSSLRGVAAGVFVGISTFDYAGLRYAQHDYEGIDHYFATGGVLSVAAGRLSYTYGLTGPSMAVDTACSSSLVAVHLACQSLRNRECPVALVGGVNVILSPELSINFSKARMLAPDGRCKTFDASADGYVRGEGCGVIVLKRFSDALADGDRIVALIRGSAVNQDGPSGGLTVPSGPSQEEVVRQALAVGGVQAAEVGYLEAHGTGTSLGDPIEVGSLGKVFGERAKEDPLFIGSVKTNIGHLEAASGIAGLMKVVLSLQECEIPPHLHFEKPNPHIEWEKLPFAIPTGLRKWPEGRRRIAGVSSFGVTGTNAHVVLEEGPVGKQRKGGEKRPLHILALSAKSEEALKELAGRYAAHIAANPEDDIADVCYTANWGRSHFEERIAVTGSSREEIAAGCSAYHEGREAERVTRGRKEGTKKIAFLFTGEGCGDAGMGRALYAAAPAFRKVFDRCGKILQGRLSRPLLATVDPAGESKEPRDEAYDQAALFALEYGLFALWKSWGVEPFLLLGHGAGEYAAACAAGVFSLEEGLPLIAARGRLMGKRSGAGEQYAVHFRDFQEAAAGINYRRPAIGVVSGLTGELVTGEMAGGDYWVRQAGQPVRYEAGIETLRRQGCEVFLELGPQRLWPEIGRTSLPHGGGLWLPGLGEGEYPWGRLLKNLGELYGQGITPDWAGFDKGYGRNSVTLPTYPFQRERHWMEGLERQRRTQEDKAAGRQERKAHPLLGRRLPTAHNDVIFESHITKDAPSFLGQHRIYGAPVFPATGYVEMALAAGAELLGSEALVLEDFAIRQPLILSEEEGRTLQMIARPEEGAGYVFEVFSEEAAGQWKLHASGRIGGTKEACGVEGLAMAQARCSEDLSMEERQEFRMQGITYGPNFQGLEHLRRGKGEALGFLRAPESIEVELGSYRLHPALFDAGLQACTVIIPGALGPGDYLPVGIKKLNMFSPLPATLWSHARLSGIYGEDHCNIDFSLYDERGRVCLQVAGLSVRRASRETLLRRLDGDEEQALYETAWEPAPLQNEVVDGRDLGKWLIFTDKNGLGEKTAGALRARGAETVLVYRSKRYERKSEDLYDVNPLEPEDLSRLLDDAGRACQGVLHLWSLDSGGKTDRASLEEGAIYGWGSVLHLVQALCRAECRPRVWLVTRGAQAAGDHGEAAALHQSPLGGLNRVIALEHPEFRSACLDLDPVKEGEEENCLMQELLHPDEENQVVYRKGVRYGARLVRVGARKKSTDESIPRNMKIREYGIIDNLFLEPQERRKPGRGEVEIQVKATGLNFRDVLRALGMLKDYELQLRDASDATFGFECSGRITAAGEGVRGLRAGDEVIAGLTATGSLGSYVTLGEECVVKKPEWMTHEEGATIPLAFLTACYGLEHLARIQPGERILIHAAAGGVGLAAIQIAQRAGTEVYATASREKWDYLKTQGVEGVMNSRTLDFAEEIMALTGGRGVDVVLNSLTGEYIPRNLDILAQGGRFVEIGKIGIWEEEKVRQRRADILYYPFDLGEVTGKAPGLLRKMMAELMEGFEKRELRPLRYSLFGIGEAAKAFRYMAQARHIGKVVITQEEKKIGIRPDVTYLITGGLGALGLETARWMAEKGAGNLALMGRSRPSAAAQETLGELERRGVQVRVFQADVTRGEEVSRMLKDLSAHMPPLKGVVHAAGVLDDGVLMRLGLGQFRKVMAPKVDGVWNLHEETRGLDLDFFVCYSSVVSVLGSAGQANYAAANAFLDCYVRERRRQGLHGLSINWGPWEVGMAAGLDSRGRERIAAQGLETIGLQRGFRVLEQMLLHDETSVCLLAVNWEKYLSYQYGGAVPRFFKRVSGKGPETKLAPGKKSAILRKLEVSLPRERRVLLLEYVRERVAAELGETLLARIGPRQRLFDLGVDSLMAVELRNRFESELEISLHDTLVFDYPTSDALVDHLMEALPFPKEAMELSVPARDEKKKEDAIPSVGMSLAELSQDEIAQMLAQELWEMGKEKM